MPPLHDPEHQTNPSPRITADRLRHTADRLFANALQRQHTAESLLALDALIRSGMNIEQAVAALANYLQSRQ